MAAGADTSAGKKPGRWVDWLVGIVVGIVLGIAVVIAFLVFGSEGTIDAPKIHGVDSGAPPPQSRPLEPVKE